MSYPSDLSDDEWALIEHPLPSEGPAAAILSNPEDVGSVAVQARYDRLLADIRDEASPTLSLRKMAAQFIKVTASYGPQILACYDVPDLPLTDNGLEQLFGGVGHQLRRTNGQKNAPASLVVRGAAVASRERPFTASDLAAVDTQRWRKQRALLSQRHLPRILGQRFRLNPQTYQQELEAQLVKLSLPP